MGYLTIAYNNILLITDLSYSLLGNWKSAQSWLDAEPLSSFFSSLLPNSLSLCLLFSDLVSILRGLISVRKGFWRRRFFVPRVHLRRRAGGKVSLAGGGNRWRRAKWKASERGTFQSGVQGGGRQKKPPAPRAIHCATNKQPLGISYLEQTFWGAEAKVASFSLYSVVVDEWGGGALYSMVAM